MKITVDEHIPLMTVRALQDLGHDIRDIRGTPDEGMQDEELWEMVQARKRKSLSGKQQVARRGLTTASSLTAACERFWANVKRFGGAAPAEAER